MAEKKGFLRIDANGAKPPTGQAFVTAVVTLTGTAYNTLAVPDNAYECKLSCATAFTVGESAAATGWEDFDFDFGCAKMSNIYIKGANAQVIKVWWTTL